MAPYVPTALPPRADVPESFGKPQNVSAAAAREPNFQMVPNVGEINAASTLPADAYPASEVDTPHLDGVGYVKPEMTTRAAAAARYAHEYEQARFDAAPEVEQLLRSVLELLAAHREKLVRRAEPMGYGSKWWHGERTPLPFDLPPGSGATDGAGGGDLSALDDDVATARKVEAALMTALHSADDHSPDDHSPDDQEALDDAALERARSGHSRSVAWARPKKVPLSVLAAEEALCIGGDAAGADEAKRHQLTLLYSSRPPTNAMRRAEEVRRAAAAAEGTRHAVQAVALLRARCDLLAHRLPHIRGEEHVAMRLLASVIAETPIAGELDALLPAAGTDVGAYPFAAGTAHAHVADPALLQEALHDVHRLAHTADNHSTCGHRTVLGAPPLPTLVPSKSKYGSRPRWEEEGRDAFPGLAGACRGAYPPYEGVRDTWRPPPSLGATCADDEAGGFYARELGMPNPRMDDGVPEMENAVHHGMSDVAALSALVPTGGAPGTTLPSQDRVSGGTPEAIATFHERFRYAPKFEPMRDDANWQESELARLDAAVARMREQDAKRAEQRAAATAAAEQAAAGMPSGGSARASSAAGLLGLTSTEMRAQRDAAASNPPRAGGGPPPRGPLAGGPKAAPGMQPSAPMATAPMATATLGALRR